MKKILVVGDTILDHYVHGTVSRVNPEAPHSVVLDYEKENVTLGGAANVAANIKSLVGGDAMVHYFGAVSPQVSDLLTEEGVAIPDITHPDEQILLKTRYICDKHYLLRVDRGRKYEFGESFEHLLNSKLMDYDYDLIVISDYDKGTLMPSIVERLFKTRSKIIFDLKKQKNFPRGVCKRENVVIKCNKSEFESEVTKELVREVDAVIQTLGAQGASIWRFNDQDSLTAQPAIGGPDPTSGAKDVVGAGDAFLAGMALCAISQYWSPTAMAMYGNNCGAAKVKNFGTYVLMRGDL